MLDYVALLSSRASFCEFGNYVETEFLHQFVTGINNIEYHISTEYGINFRPSGKPGTDIWEFSAAEFCKR